MFKNLHLETERLIIRPYTMDDAPALYAIISRDEVVEYLPEKDVTFAETQKILTWIMECYEQNTPQQIKKFSVAVVEKDSGALIGWVGLGPLDFAPEEIEIYYGLSPDYWGRGIATEAARALLRYGFEVIGLDTIVAIVHPDNGASIRVIEKMGLPYRKIIGSLPPEHKFFEGLRYYSMDRAEFAEVRKGY